MPAASSMAWPSVCLRGLAAPDKSLYVIECAAAEDELAAPSIARYNQDVAPSEAAARAAQQCLRSSGAELSEVDFVISCTETPDFNNPGLVSCALHRLGKVGIPGLELRQLVSGPLYALDLASKLIATNQARTILVLACDFFSRHFERPLNLPAGVSAHAALAARTLGDGAAALLVQAAQPGKENRDGFALVCARLISNPAGSEAFACKLPSSSQFPLRLTKDDVAAGRHLPEIDAAAMRTSFNSQLGSELEQFLCSAGHKSADLKHVICHQLYRGMNKEAAAAFGLTAHSFHDVFDQSGHVGSSGLLLGLLQLQQLGTLGSGDVVLLCALASGHSRAYALLRKL